jgi:hypothetical protein
MKHLVTCISLLVVCAIGSVSQAAQAGEREAILKVVEKAFEAVAARDPQLWRAVLLEEGISLSFRAGADGAPEMRLIRNGDFIAGTQPDGKTYEESFTEEPTVLIRGPIAVVWGEYAFRIDGEFSHCGVDNIDLVKVDGEWKIANFLWTVERQGCPTAPEE